LARRKSALSLNVEWKQQMRAWSTVDVGIKISSKILAVLIAACFFGSLYPLVSYADELTAVREQINAKVGELDDLNSEVKAAKQSVKDLDVQIQKTLDEIDAKQEEHARLQSSMANMTVELYKDSADFDPVLVLESSESLQQLMRHLDMNEKVLDAYSDVIKQVQEARDGLNLKYKEVSDKKDEQQACVKSLQNKAKKLDDAIVSLRKQEKALSIKEQAQLAQAAAEAHEVAQTFETGTMGNDKLEWKTGLTTAYGGSSDKVTPKDEPTATGTICDDWSIGVAVPLKWGPEKYYGRYVEISYEDQSVIAPVVDCGYMGNGYVSFDLQPGVFKAFGCSDCDEWGVREVRYRFIT